MPVWRTETERDAWVERNCRVCFQPDEAALRVLNKPPGCPHRVRGDQGKMPQVWKKRRNAVIGETYACAAFVKEPPTAARRSAPADTAPLFDDPGPDEYRLVPVEGWRDFRAEARKQADGDHQ